MGHKKVLYSYDWPGDFLLLSLFFSIEYFPVPHTILYICPINRVLDLLADITGMYCYSLLKIIPLSITIFLNDWHVKKFCRI